MEISITGRDNCKWKKPPKLLAGNDEAKTKIWLMKKTSKCLKRLVMETEKGWPIKNFQTFAELMEKNWEILAYSPSLKRYSEEKLINCNYRLVGKKTLWFKSVMEKPKVGRIKQAEKFWQQGKN